MSRLPSLQKARAQINSQSTLTLRNSFFNPHAPSPHPARGGSRDPGGSSASNTPHTSSPHDPPTFLRASTLAAQLQLRNSPPAMQSGAAPMSSATVAPVA